MWQILGSEGAFAPHAWAAPKRPILNWFKERLRLLSFMLSCLMFTKTFSEHSMLWSSCFSFYFTFSSWTYFDCFLKYLNADPIPCNRSTIDDYLRACCLGVCFPSKLQFLIDLSHISFFHYIVNLDVAV